MKRSLSLAAAVGLLVALPLLPGCPGDPEPAPAEAPSAGSGGSAGSSDTGAGGNCVKTLTACVRPAGAPAGQLYDGPADECGADQTCVIPSTQASGFCRSCLPPAGEGGASASGGAQAGGENAGGAGEACVAYGPKCLRPEGANANEDYVGPTAQCSSEHVCVHRAGDQTGICYTCAPQPAGAGGGAGSGAGGSDPGAGGSSGGAAGQTGGGTERVMQCGDHGPACTRPADTALSAPWTGVSGEDGCAVNARCEVSVGQNQGECMAPGCHPQKGDPAVPATLSGSALCNAPYQFSFMGLRGEIYKYTVSMTLASGPLGGVNAGGRMRLEGMDTGDTGQAFYGVANVGVLSNDTRVFALKESGTWTFEGFNESCDVPVTFTGTLERLEDTPPNGTPGSAKPLVRTGLHSGAMGCDQALWYVYEATAGEHMKLTFWGHNHISGYGVKNDAQVRVLRSPLAGETEYRQYSDDMGAVDFGYQLKDETQDMHVERTVTFNEAGVYWIKMNSGYSCSPASFSLTSD